LRRLHCWRQFRQWRSRAANRSSRSNLRQEPNNGSANLSPAEIKRAQQALDQKGFKAGSADGKLGPETEQAIKQFQEKQGLQQTGQLDEQTLSALGIQSQNQRSTTGQGAQQPAQNQPSDKK
jgi:peptidoglycan hydrolase-like protein with peptidoglycan-binding domain